MAKKQGGEAITRKAFDTIVEQHGKEAARLALRQFIDDSMLEHRLGPVEKELKSQFESNPRSFINDAGSDITFSQVNEAAALIGGRIEGTNKISNKQAKVLTLAALKPEIGADKARFARLRSTQRQRAAQAGASQTIGTTPQGLFDPAHLARRQLTDNPFFRSGGRA